MGNTKADHIDELVDAVRRYAKRSSAGEVAALAASPTVVTSALAAVSNALVSVQKRSEAMTPESIGGPRPELVDAASATARLDAHTRKVHMKGLIGSEEVARRIGVKTRQSVHQRLKKGQLIGFDGARRGAMFPEEQFDERGRTLSGIAEVRALMPDGYTAWMWLTTPLAALGDVTPIDRLRVGAVDEVVLAARGEAQGDFT